MTRDEATAELVRRVPALRERGALSAFVYGSTARKEARDDIDIDIFIEMNLGGSSPFSIWSGCSVTSRKSFTSPSI